MRAVTPPFWAGRCNDPATIPANSTRKKKIGSTFETFSWCSGKPLKLCLTWLGRRAAAKKEKEARERGCTVHRRLVGQVRRGEISFKPSRCCFRSHRSRDIVGVREGERERREREMIAGGGGLGRGAGGRDKGYWDEGRLLDVLDGDYAGRTARTGAPGIAGGACIYCQRHDGACRPGTLGGSRRRRINKFSVPN